MMAENKMEVMPVGKLIFEMSLPPLFSMFLQYSYNLLDSAFVARLSENALTAVSLSFPITTLMNAVSIWIGVGINVLIAGHLGKREQEEANKTVTLGLILSFLVGIILNITVLLIISPYFKSFTENNDIYTLCMEYMGVCSFMQIPNMVHIVIQKMIQATGNMIEPMLFQLTGVITNFIFDPLLIFGIGFFPAMGIKGAATATVLGYSVSMVLAFIMFLKAKHKIALKTVGFRFEWSIVQKIIILGLPSFIMNALNAFTVTIVNLFLVAYSDTSIAFFGAYFKIQQLIIMTINGLIQGCLPIMRFNYGAGNLKRLQSVFRYSTILVTSLMMFGTLIIMLFPTQILSLFMASEKMRSYGIMAMRIMAAGYLFCGLSTMISTYMQAIERVLPSIMIQIFRQMFFLIPIMWILEKALLINGIWIAFPVTELLTFVAAVILFMRLKFQNNNKDIVGGK